MTNIKRGQIYHMDLGEVEPGTITSVQKGKRYVIIVSNNKNNECAKTVNVLPCTSKTHKVYPFHADLEIYRASLALAEQIVTVDKSALGEFVREASAAEMMGVDKAIRLQLGL